MNKYSLAIHGGAGTILRSEMSAEKEAKYLSALEAALHTGIEILDAGGTSVDAVTESVKVMEDSPLFNAGRGSVFTSDGGHEMEASIMNGDTLMAGAVAAVKHVKNPISLSKQIMKDSELVYLSGDGALQYAKEHGLKIVDEKYFYDQFRYDQWQQIKDSGKSQLDHSASQDHKFGTVGAVALDLHGNLAAATSTGGLTNKKYGRLGDSSVIGSGTYADNNTCAVSCTGYGEYFLRTVIAHEIAAKMEYSECNLQEAARYVLDNKLTKIGGEGGFIAVDAQGNIELCFNSEGMYRGWANSDINKLNVDIYRS